MKIKIGTNKGKPRICLWSSKMIDAGFPIGQPITVEVVHGKARPWVAECPKQWLILIRAEIPAQTILRRTADSNFFPKPQAKMHRPRKVSGVTNHGKKIPVIDLKTTQALDISKLGNAGDFVEVTYNKNLIIIKSL